MSRDIFSASAMRQLLRRARICTLSTLDRESGTPYGSLANLATDFAGAPVLLLSRLAWHTQNLLVDNRASVLASILPAQGDALTGERVTVMGRLVQVPSEQVADLRQHYLAQHGEAQGYIDFADFSLWRMVADKLHGVAGFGRIDSYQAAEVFPDASALSEIAASALAHINEDHSAALQLYATRLLRAKAGEWRMVSLDCDGAVLAKADQQLRLEFPEAVLDEQGLRQMLARLSASAQQAPK